MARIKIVLALLLIVLCASTVHAEVVIETVVVGNPGNAGKWSGESQPGGSGPDRICGAVDYVFEIGKFEVTVGQYAEFLNAVAVNDDTYDLYNEGMATPPRASIERTASPPYTYTVVAGRENLPVDYIGWGDAARFANWLHNGQPGLGTPVPQDQNSTEDGSYALHGALTDAELYAIERREGDATWVIPSEDEWYKAAYHKNNGATGDYWDYPTSSDSLPAYICCSADDSNAANYDLVCGEPRRSDVGCYEIATSPYGTFDQGGNIMEWNESKFPESLPFEYRGFRGGAWPSISHYMQSVARSYSAGLELGNYDFGFRVAKVEPLPVPALSSWGMLAMVLLVLTAGTVAFRWRKPILQ